MRQFTQLSNVSSDIAENVNTYIRSLYQSLMEKHPEGFDTLEERNAFQDTRNQLTAVVAPLERLGHPVSLLTEEEYDWNNKVFAKTYPDAE